jgi:hypothetical protein
MNARLDYQQEQDSENERIEMTLKALESAKEHGTPEIHLNWLAHECGVARWWRHVEEL